MKKRVPAPKTVVHASKQLPESVRADFIRAFKATGAMDLYDGEVAGYMAVIASKMEERGERVKELEDACRKITAVANGGVS